MHYFFLRRMIIIALTSVMIFFVQSTFATDDDMYRAVCGLKVDWNAACWVGEGWTYPIFPPVGTFTQISVGAYQACGLRSDGTITCSNFGWGASPATPPIGVFTQLSVWYHHSCGLRSDRTAVCWWWWENAYGQASPPTEMFKQIAVWYYHTCGLKTDETIICWGENVNNEATPPPWIFKQISVWLRHSCALRPDGTVVCWGGNRSGEATPPPWIFKQISVWLRHSCALRPDGTVVCWGNGSSLSMPSSSEKFTQILAWRFYTCGLRENGTVLCWAYNYIWGWLPTPPTGIIFKALGSSSPVGTTSPPLSLLSSTPANSSQNIPITTPITLTFPTPLDPTKVASNVFVEHAGNSVSYSVLLGDNNKTVTLVPSIGTWNTNTTYIVKLLPGLADANGNTLGTEKDLSFRTEATPENPTVSTVPVTSSTLPTCNAYGYTLSDPLCTGLNHQLVAINQTVSLSSSADAQAVGDPVSLSSGEFTYSNTLLSIPGSRLPYSLDLTYRSQTYANGPVGIDWDHGYDIFLRENANGSVTYLDGKLGMYTFTKGTDGTFDFLPGINAMLAKNTDGTYRIDFWNGKRYSFGSNLRIANIADRYGNTLSFSYDAENKLAKAIDSLGHEIVYGYSDDKRLKSVTATSGRSVTFAYFGEGEDGGNISDLQSVTIRNGTETKNISFTYSKVANDPMLSHNLLTLTDSKGQIYVENTYDEHDRVIAQKYGNGTIRYAYTLDEAGKTVAKNTVTNKKGGVTEYVFDRSGNILSKAVKQADSTVETRYAYDTKGRIVSETKPLGNGTTYRYDDRGNRVEKRKKQDMTQPDNDQNDLVTKYVYNTAFDTLAETTDPNGTRTVFTSDDRGNIVKIETKNIHTTTDSTQDILIENAYDDKGHLVKTTDAEGRIMTYEYDANGFPTKVTTGIRHRFLIPDDTTDAAPTVYAYDSFGNPLTVTDPEGNVRTFTYDAFDRLRSSTTAEGIVKNFSYDANNLKTWTETILDPTKKLTETTEYDLLDAVTGITAGSDSTDTRHTAIVRDANGNITETTDARGTKTKYTYDALERVTEKRIITRLTPSPSPSEERGVVTKYAYDANGNLTAITDPLGNVTSISYDRFDRSTSKTDALGTKTVSAYDKNGNVTETSIIDKNGTLLVRSATAYNEFGKALSQTVTDPKTNTTLTTKYEYDRDGNMVAKTDPKGNRTVSEYDAQKRIKSATDALGNKTVFAYDKRGLVTSKTITGTNGIALTIAYAYDRDGRLVKETDNEGKSKSYAYDALGNVTQTIDEAGNKTDYTYDVFGNMLSETKYLSLTPTLSPGAREKVVTSYEYDTSNNRTKLTDPKGNITTYTYDSLNRLVRETLADGSAIAYEYDAAGNIVQKTDANGTVVNNTYDALGRLVKRTIQRGANILGVTEENYTYDALGRLTGSTDSEGNILAFSYDAFGRLVSETQNGKTVQTGYDANSNITSLVYPSGKEIDRTYDALNRLIDIRHPELVSGSSASIATYSYNSLTLDTVTLANGAKTAYGYDAMLRLKELTNFTSPEKKTPNGEIINKLAFSYAPNSNILSNGHDTYSYDSLNRLTQAGYEPLQDKKSTTESFVYDPMGNRTESKKMKDESRKEDEKKKEKDDKANKTKIDTTNYTSNELNQYTGIDKTKLVYDRNGNLISNGKFRFSYDYRNRLVKAVKAALTPNPSPKGERGEKDEKEKKDTKEYELVAQYSYDTLGRRLSKETNKTLIKYTYSNQDAIQEDVYEKEDKKLKLKEVRENIYGQNIDDILATIRTKYDDGKAKETKTYFSHKNQLGSITAITDEKGKVAEEYRYDAFGKAYTRDGKSNEWREFQESKTGNSRLFTGREYDTETGLHYYRARYYSAEMGRFMSRDPIGTSDNINLYSYVGDSPVMYVDSMGREKTMLAIREITKIFNETANYFSWINSIYNGDTSFSILANEEYATELLLGQENFKMNQTLVSLANGTVADWNKISCPTALDGDRQCGWYFMINNTKVTLADIGNIGVGYFWQKIGFDYWYIEEKALVVTRDLKFWGDMQQALENEISDRPYYRAWYNFATTHVWNLSETDIRNLLTTNL